MLRKYRAIVWIAKIAGVAIIAKISPKTEPLIMTAFFCRIQLAQNHLRLSSCKIDLSVPYIGVDELYPQLVADIGSMLTSYEHPFNMRLQHTNKCTLRPRPGNNRVEHLADA